MKVREFVAQLLAVGDMEQEVTVVLGDGDDAVELTLGDIVNDDTTETTVIGVTE